MGEGRHFGKATCQEEKTSPYFPNGVDPLLFKAVVKRTYQPKKRKRGRVHGFLRRSKTPGGRRVLKERRQKKRKKISV